MKIIWLTPEIPFPPIGGRNGVFNRIKQLSKNNEIFLFSIAYNEEEKNSAMYMKSYCKEVNYYNRNESKIKKVLKSIVDPYTVASRTLPELRQDIIRCMKDNDIDIIITDFPNMAKNILGLEINCYCTLNQHNNEYRRMRDMYYIKTLSFFKRIAYLLESYRLEDFEKRLYSSNLYQSITFFSTDDCKAFSDKWTSCNAELKVFPLGANAVKNNIECQDKLHNTMLFVGRLDNVATTNVEAINWFCNEILPEIEKKVDVNIVIAGANPTESITKLAKKNVKVIANYKDLDSVYSLADYVILPLLSGGGVKGKLLEAAAYGKIIISTKHGIEGTEFIPGEHVFYGDNKQDFINKCIEAIENPIDAQIISNNAKELFESKYNWEKIGDEYEKYLIENSKSI